MRVHWNTFVVMPNFSLETKELEYERCMYSVNQGLAFRNQFYFPLKKIKMLDDKNFIEQINKLNLTFGPF